MVKYPQGEKRIVIPANAHVVRNAFGSKDDLKAGAAFRANAAAKQPDGTYTAGLRVAAASAAQPHTLLIFADATAAHPDTIFPILRAKIRELDANLPVYGMRMVQEDLNDTLVTERMTANLSAVFGFLATLLAIIVGNEYGSPSGAQPSARGASSSAAGSSALSEARAALHIAVA